MAYVDQLGRAQRIFEIVAPIKRRGTICRQVTRPFLTTLAAPTLMVGVSLWAVVGAWGDGDTSTWFGSAYLYRCNGGTLDSAQP